MLRGIYTAAAGMLVQQRRTDVVANNLANASTTGYKRDVALVRPFPNLNLHRTTDGQRMGSLTTGAGIEGIRPQFSPGGVRHTGNPLDLAVEGGFFTVQTPAGIAYTKAGNFSLDGAGYLVTARGDRVLGTRGPIRIDNADFTVTEEGDIIVAGEIVDRLAIAELTGDVEKLGDNLFYGQGIPAQEVKVSQGFLEDSNVNVVREMVDLITATRAYEANQRIIQAHDETLGKAVNEMAR
ncbi:MAG: flagellar hook-basal body protein [Limnochordia bacterium]|jgi:flagellar basal-body rod protein FlgF